MSFHPRKANYSHQQELNNRLSKPRGFLNSHVVEIQKPTPKKTITAEKVNEISERLHRQSIKCKKGAGRAELDAALKKGRSTASPQQVEAITKRLHGSQIKCRTYPSVLPRKSIGKSSLQPMINSNSKLQDAMKMIDAFPIFRSKRKKNLIDVNQFTQLNNISNIYYAPTN